LFHPSKTPPPVTWPVALLLKKPQAQVEAQVEVAPEDAANPAPVALARVACLFVMAHKLNKRNV
jgi:hypothetical protein